jgi:hypothetical protein
MTAIMPSQTSSSLRDGVLEIVKNVDLTGMSKIYIDWEGESTEAIYDVTALLFSIGGRNGTYSSTERQAITILLMAGGGIAARQTSEIIIDNVQDECDVYVSICSAKQETKITIYNVWME